MQFQKKYFLLLSVILFSFYTKAKSNDYCGSLRYDTEIFQTVQITSNITFGSNTSSGGVLTTLKLDVYEPAGDSLTMRPLIVWVHGGSFVAGTKADADIVSLCQHFAKRGYVCASIEYRLGFSVFPPTSAVAKQEVFLAMQDMKAAVRYFRKDAATSNTFRIDPSMIFGGGSSAGAFTALHLAYLDEPSEISSEIDTALIGGLEGNSGNPGYPSTINAVINLCGALGDKTWIHTNDIPVVSMHGDRDGTVPYATATIYLLGIFPIMVVDGSFSISDYANSIGLRNEMFTYYGADHVPYAANLAYMDTTVRFVSNFLYNYMGCTPSDPFPLGNTSTTGINFFPTVSDFSVSPNPGNGIFRFNFSGFEKVQRLSIFDVSGRKLKEFNDFKNTAIVNLSDFGKGIYFYTLSSEKKYFSGKLVIQN